MDLSGRGPPKLSSPCAGTGSPSKGLLSVRNDHLTHRSNELPQIRNTSQPRLCNSGWVARQAPGRFCLDQPAQSGLHGYVGPRRPSSGTYLSIENCVVPQTTGVCPQSSAGEVRSGWETQFSMGGRPFRAAVEAGQCGPVLASGGPGRCGARRLAPPTDAASRKRPRAPGDPGQPSPTDSHNYPYSCDGEAVALGTSGVRV